MEGLYSMQTLLEAMDWLESKGVRIAIRFRTQIYDGKKANYWYYEILTPEHKMILEYDESGVVVMYTNRNECMNEAIKKGVELL